MQTAKNLYLWSGRSYVRKAAEVPLAYLMSVLWPKARMMEVYLNVAQFGRGIFGVEAASRLFPQERGEPHPPRDHSFGRGAAKSAFRNPARPSRHMLVIARAIERACRSWRGATVAQ